MKNKLKIKMNKYQIGIRIAVLSLLAFLSLFSFWLEVPV